MWMVMKMEMAKEIWREWGLGREIAEGKVIKR
jgi:hypothetical protein